MAKKIETYHRLKAVLKEKGYSGYWLAQETGISYTSIHSYISNKVVPSLPNLFIIADTLKVSPKELLSR